MFLTYPASPAYWRRWFKARDAGGKAATPYYNTESRVFNWYGAQRRAWINDAGLWLINGVAGARRRCV